MFPRIMRDEKCPQKGLFVQISNLSAAKALQESWQQGAVRIPVPAGALLLWDNRTTHQGWQGGGRLAQPVCWQPRELRDGKARTRKLRCCALGLPTSHSALRGSIHPAVGRGLAPATPVTMASGEHYLLRPSLLPAPSVDFPGAWGALTAEGASPEKYVSTEYRRWC